MPRRTQFVLLKPTYRYKNWYETLSPPKGEGWQFLSALGHHTYQDFQRYQQLLLSQRDSSLLLGCL